MNAEGAQQGPGRVEGPYRVHQTFTTTRGLPRYLVVGPGNLALRTSNTVRGNSRKRTWASEAAAQDVADQRNQLHRDATVEFEATRAAIAKAVCP